MCGECQNAMVRLGVAYGPLPAPDEDFYYYDEFDPEEPKENAS